MGLIPSLGEAKLSLIVLLMKFGFGSWLHTHMAYLKVSEVFYLHSVENGCGMITFKLLLMMPLSLP
jgi:hypothetical protein